MKRFKSLVREVHRRSLWQVMTIYVVASWIGYQVVLALYEGIGLPAWVPGLAIALFVIGLPVVLATAFIQEGGPIRSGTVTGLVTETVEGLESVQDVLGSGANRAGRDAAMGSAEVERREMPTGPASRPAALFTWSRAITGGVLAFAILGLGTTGFMGMRSLGIGPAGTLMAKGVIEARDPLILVDFENGTGEPQLGDVVTDALRIDLLSSPVIRLVGEPEIREALALMRSEGSRLDEALGREVAVRAGYRGLILGEIATVGAGYALTARVVAAADGETLAGFRESAVTADDLLPAIDRLSQAIRAKIGESLKSARAGEPLARVTTSSLEALRKYSQAERLVNTTGDYLRAAALMEEAVALDTAFAMAWRKLGTYYANALPERSRPAEALLAAYRFRDRLNERERALAEASYHMHVTGDDAAAIHAYENLLAVYPEDDVAVNNLAILYSESGRHEEALALLAPRRAAGTLSPLNYVNLLGALASLGRYDEAEEALDAFARDFPDAWYPHFFRTLYHGLRGERQEARRLSRDLAARYSSNLIVAGRATIELSMYDAAEGRLASHVATLREVAGMASAAGLDVITASVLAQIPVTYAATLGDPEAVEAAVREVYDRIDLQDLPAVDRPYARLALAHARSGQPDRAEQLLNQAEREIPEPFSAMGAPEREIVRGLIASARGDHELAIRRIREGRRAANCGPCDLDLLGLAYERAGDDDAAIAAYTEYIETPHFMKVESDQTALAFSLERLANLHDDRGDLDRAVDYYGRFIDLWQHADPLLQPRVDAVRRRIAALAAEH